MAGKNSNFVINEVTIAKPEAKVYHYDVLMAKFENLAVKPRSIEGLESSRPSESLKATKSRPHQVRISNPQKTSESVGLCHHLITWSCKSINKKILTTTTTQYLVFIMSPFSASTLQFSCFFSWAVNSFHVAAAYDQRYFESYAIWFSLLQMNISPW